MRPVQTQVMSANGNSDPVVLDPRGFKDSVALTLIISGALTAKIQYTNDDVFASGWSAASANWFDHPTLTNKTASDTGNFAVPITAIRLVVSGYANGSAYARAHQGE